MPTWRRAEQKSYHEGYKEEAVLRLIGKVDVK